MIRNNMITKTFRLTLPARYFTPCKNLNNFESVSFRSISHSTSYSTVATALTDKLNSVTKQFDSVLGISEVRTAQSFVQVAEDEFMKSRRHVEDTRTELVRLQSQLRDLRSKLDRIPREDERYLQLATEEHKVLLAERKAKGNLETLEMLERDKFSALSTAVRSAHEKERSRAERTKYWSIIGSACGAVLGILGSTIINVRRMKQIRSTVEENNEAFIAKTLEELRTLFKPEQQSGLTNSEVAVERSQIANDIRVLLHENRNVLSAIDEKVERISNEETLASKVQELVVSCNETSQMSNLENSCSVIELNRHIQDLTWWTKASFIATVTASAALMLYMFTK